MFHREGRSLVQWALALVLGTAIHAAVEYPTFTRSQLEADFDQFRSVIERRHPLLYADREELATAYPAQRALLREGMSEIEFMRVLAPLLRALNCGHSSLSLAASTENATMADRRYVPFDPRIIDDRLWVVNAPGDSPLTFGAEIVAINGRAWAQIRALLYDRLPADGQNITRKRHYLNYDFARAYNLAVEDMDTYTVTYVAPGSSVPVSVTLDGLSPAAWSDLPGVWWAADLEVGLGEFRDDHAYLYIKTFNFYDPAGRARFRDFVDAFFAELTERGVSKLVLDVRGNGGGDPYMGAHLLSYFLKAAVPYFAPDSALYPDLKSPVLPQTHRFPGDLVTLIDGGVFSTNGHFVSLLKYHGIGTLVGEETGGSFATTSNNLTTSLGHTGLRFSYATDVFTTAVAGLTPGRGIMPDIVSYARLEDMAVGHDPQLATALRALDGGGAPPLIGAEPATQSATPGQNVSLLVRVDGTGPMTYRWRKDGVYLDDGYGPLFTLSPFLAADAGRYDVLVQNATGRVTSAAAVLTLGDATGEEPARLANLSSRSVLAPGDDVTISGFVISGDLPREVLIRGVGPGLNTLGVTNALRRPELSLYRGREWIAANTDWRTGEREKLRLLAARLGAFTLREDAADCAMVVRLEPGLYSVHLRDADRVGGVGLVEVYDTEPEAVGESELINLSTQARVAGDEATLVSGLVIPGTASHTVLLRAIGPGLTAYGTGDALSRPRLALLAGAQTLLVNTGWETGNARADVVSAAAWAGAFPLAPGSADAALLVTLPPGVYTIEAQAADGGTGRVLAEVYSIKRE
ncbi:S41 family peptidase [Synoicihabitans lomoniglobus]|uniref:S41 family peptidase n=1 Tax=Synoicihabitans lomoniglobus TaxID=2909285 RepID=A0AAE9ZX97_9BACT|nr:S41 family peptidase [Opitutaceae bacterium LMO-M01]WED65171.1 S41 family peptidase [Opitutaceae bacterium LMO-M01]